MKYIEIVLICLILFSLICCSTLLKYVILLVACLILKPNLTNILYAGIGFLIAPYIVNIGMIFILKENPTQNVKYSISLDDFVDTSIEELLWRWLLFSKLIQGQAFCNTFFVMIISMTMFMLMHNIKLERRTIEMTGFTVIIYIVAILFPGMNYGLHFGRNTYINTMNKE